MEAHVVPAEANLKAAVQELLPVVDFQRCSIHDFRRKLEEHLQAGSAKHSGRVFAKCHGPKGKHGSAID